MESIIHKYGAEFEREKNVGGNKNGDCSVFTYAFVGRSNPFQAEAFSLLYDQQTRPVHMYYFIKQWRSCK